ncbi:MAG: response regulator transcription factor [Clostridiales bacterium]|jgi:DNA-binding NarL/FixJ family response regulator|nr:response regulator transcription factor [Clostridiales bacterium]
MIKVLIADDQELIRQSLEIVLSSKPDILVAATASDGNEVLELIKADVPDVVLMDIRMPGMDGISCTKFIKLIHPEVKIILLTTFDDDDYVFSALRLGASGYLLKGVSVDSLYDAVKAVHKGGSLLTPEIASKVFREFSKMPETPKKGSPIPTAANLLLPNEKKIAIEIGRGLSNKEIAKKLAFSEGTVRNYLSSILSKLDLRDRTQLAIWAIQSGLMKSEEEL